MGFSGGGSNVTKPHTHDSNIVQDGGSLAANVTQFGLTAGSILYSDGANIQELAVGSASDTLTVNGAATAPEWAAAGGAAGWTNEGSDTNTSAGTSLDVTVSDADVYQILYNVCDGGGTSSMCMRINDVTSSSYDSIYATQGSGVGTDTKTKWLMSGGGSTQSHSGTAYVYKSDSNFPASQQGGVTFTNELGKYTSTAPTNLCIASGTNTSITGAVTKISLLCLHEGTAANEDIIGSMQVFSMSY
jgi:hypothetical protein